MTVLGIVLAAVPLALWFAWSKTFFFAVLATGAVALAVIYLLGRFDGRVGDTSLSARPEPPQRPG